MTTITTKDIEKPPMQKRLAGIQDTYSRSLRGIAREIGRFVKGYIGADPLNPDKQRSLMNALRKYSEIIGPWSLSVASGILDILDRQDKFAMQRHAASMGRALRQEIMNAPTGEAFRTILKDNVALIQSLPIEAAERIGRLVQENMMQSHRSSEITEMIMATEDVTKSRATLIARTEVSKASVGLTRARAEYVGSDGYIWRTAGDLIVRTSHRKMNGKYVKWSDPPLINEGSLKTPNMIAHHAGEIWNCRCWPDVVLPGK